MYATFLTLKISKMDNFSAFKKDKRTKVNPNQKFEIRIIMGNGGLRELFSGAGQEAFDKAIFHANKIAELHGDSIKTYLFAMSKANTLRH